MFGFSIFLNGRLTDEKKAYIQQMAENGFEGIFTSLQIPEEDSQKYAEYLKELGLFAKDNHLKLMVDISLNSLKQAGFSFEKLSELQTIGVTGLRIDAGISMEQIAKASHEIGIGLNASTITQEDIEELIKHGADFSNLEAWHNYYPRPETGVSREFFQQKTSWMNELGLQTIAFVAGDGKKRQPLYEGLPTLEEHRGGHPLANAMDLLELGTKGAYIGDEDLISRTIKQFGMYQKSDKVFLKAEWINEDYCQWILREHVNRKDEARDVFRSEQARLWKISDVPPTNCVDRNTGAITIDNEDYGRYKGEIQITKRDLPANEKVNVIGQIVEEDFPLLQHLHAAQKIEITE